MAAKIARDGVAGANPMSRRAEIHLQEPHRAAPDTAQRGDTPHEAHSREACAKHGGTAKHRLSSVAIAAGFLFKFQVLSSRFKEDAAQL